MTGSRRIRLEALLALTFALARTAFCVYRAATQALTHDEAFAFERFAEGPWSQLWSPYDAANHVLYAFLTKVSIALFGLSEFTLRLPSVLAGLVLTIATFEILSACRSTVLRWLVYVAIGLHPLLLDFSVAARGYGLSLAFLALALAALMRDRPIPASLFAGLAIGANLTAITASVGLAAARFIQTGESWRGRFRELAKFPAPAIALAAAICYLPLRTATPGSFYVGFENLKDSVFDLTYPSLHVTERAGLLGGFETARFISYVVEPVALAVGALMGIVAWRFRGKSRVWLIAPATLAVSILILLAAHRVLGLPYPLNRTGLFLIYFAGLSAALLADGAPKILRFTGTLAASLLLIQFGTQLQWHKFQAWAYDANVKEVARRIEQECRGKLLRVSVSVSPWHQPALEFYRKQYRIDCAVPFAWQENTEFTGHDYYVYNQNRPADKAPALEPVFQDPDSGIILAK